MAVAAIVLVCGLAVASSNRSGAAGFSASIRNSTDTAASGTLLVSFGYGSTCTSVPVAGASIATGTSVSCAGSMFPTVSSATLGSTEQNGGSLPASAISATLRPQSCGPVQLANRATASDPMLPRYASTLNATAGTAGLGATNTRPLSGSGSVTFNGSIDYAADVSPASVPLLAGGSTYGIWFKTTSTSGGGLFSYDSSAVVPAAPTGSNYLALYMNSAGNLGFVQQTGSTIGLTASKFNDGSWHLALVEISQITLVGLGLVSLVNLYVDGSNVTAATSASLLVVGVQGGYWHAGWSQVAGYFRGSESDFFTAAGVGSTPSVLFAAGTQAAFDASLTGVTNEWHLDDTGYTTYSGVLPGAVAAPCTMIDATWNGVTHSLATAVSTGWPTAVPAPGVVNANSAQFAHNAGYAASYVPGLQLYAPMQYSVSAGAGAWSTVFSWSQLTPSVVA